MITVYKRDEFNGSLNIIKEFNQFDDMFDFIGYQFDSKIFGYSDVQRHNGQPNLGDFYQSPPPCWMYVRRHYCYVVFDANDKFVTPDRLLGMQRKFWKNRRIKQDRKWASHRWGHHARGRLRYMRTNQEHRWAHAWDDEEFAPKVRAARQGKNLPTAWDDHMGHNEKSWKFQSKRSHQWN
jgi:hypothetical protein